MAKVIRHLEDELLRENVHPEIWEKKGGYPENEGFYYRVDHDGYRWWTKVFMVNREIVTEDLAREADMVMESFRKAFKDRNYMGAWCGKTFGYNDDNEYNAFLELEHGYYWFRMIDRKGDYNLYLHVIRRDK